MRPVRDSYDSRYPLGAHIELSDKADLLVIAPATARIIASCALGLADDLLATLYLARTCPVIMAPAMNNAMWSSQLFNAISSNCKPMVSACWDQPQAGSAAASKVLDAWWNQRPSSKPLSIVCRLPMDHSYGEDLDHLGADSSVLGPSALSDQCEQWPDGSCLAERRLKLGHAVHIISGPVTVHYPTSAEVTWVDTTKEMLEAVLRVFPTMDGLIGAGRALRLHAGACEPSEDRQVRRAVAAGTGGNARHRRHCGRHQAVASIGWWALR